MPTPRVASVLSTGVAQPPGGSVCSESIASIDETIRSAPSRSALLTTKTSAISMMPALSACTSSPVPGTSITTETSARPHDVHFILADADRLDDDIVAAGGVQHERGVGGRARQPAEVTARGHAANEHAGIGGVALHADAVAQDRAAREGAGRIDRQDADGLADVRAARAPVDRPACSCRRRAVR